MTNRIRHLATFSCKRNVVLVEAFFPLLVKGAHDVRRVCAFHTTTRLVGGKRLWSFMYQPTVLLSLIPNMNETKMADWSSTNQLVMSWLLSAIEPTIATSLMFMASAKQGNMTVAEYYTQIKTIWKEIFLYQQGFPQCRGLISSLGTKDCIPHIFFIIACN
ncbi:unnamed protein product [Prunus armeniaca]